MTLRDGPPKMNPTPSSSAASSPPDPAKDQPPVKKKQKLSETPDEIDFSCASDVVYLPHDPPIHSNLLLSNPLSFSQPYYNNNINTSNNHLNHSNHLHHAHHHCGDVANNSKNCQIHSAPHQHYRVPLYHNHLNHLHHLATSIGGGSSSNSNNENTSSVVGGHTNEGNLFALHQIAQYGDDDDDDDVDDNDVRMQVVHSQQALQQQLSGSERNESSSQAICMDTECSSSPMQVSQCPSTSTAGTPATFFNGGELPFSVSPLSSSSSSSPSIIQTHRLQFTSAVGSSIGGTVTPSGSNTDGSSTTSNSSGQQGSPSDQVVPASCEGPGQRMALDTNEAAILAFEKAISLQCLCHLSDETIQRVLSVDCCSPMSEWPLNTTLHFLTMLQLVFELYLKQNTKGHICSRVSEICDCLLLNEHDLITPILEAATHNKYVAFMSTKVLASFLIIAKTNVSGELLENLTRNLTAETADYTKMNFSLEVIKRVVDWKEFDTHLLEGAVTPSTSQEPQPHSTENRNTGSASTCKLISLTDHESFDTSAIKCAVVKSLESKWESLIKNIETLMVAGGNSINAHKHCVMTFLALWESVISVRANLSVIDTKPFYAHLDKFVNLLLLNNGLPPMIWRQLLGLFNEVLCYGSTLALQDMLPEETCVLAHLVVRCVKDFQLLEFLPYRCREGETVACFIGRIPSTNPNDPKIDRILLQKMVLLVLKSVAITVKETRCDTSDSSLGSDDYDLNMDMQMIERSIRDVLRKVYNFVRVSFEFHPDTSFSKILIHLLSDQDDYMVEAMVCTLDITVGLCWTSSSSQQQQQQQQLNPITADLVAMLNPVHTFIEFLKVVNYQTDVLLDYLVSNETCFLLYLLRFLKYVRRDWARFAVSCGNIEGGSRDELDKTMSVLIRLKYQIERLVRRRLFPYNIDPVLKLLKSCEANFENR